MHGVKLGIENCNQRLWAPVRVHPGQIQHGFALEGTRGKSLYFAGENQLSAEQSSYPISTAGRETKWFLFKVFSGPKDRRGSETHIESAFRMLMHTGLIQFVRPGNWFISIDLKDAYFDIPIYPPHRKYLRFAFHSITYKYMVLLFGLLLSPPVFV